MKQIYNYQNIFKLSKFHNLNKVLFVLSEIFWVSLKTNIHEKLKQVFDKVKEIIVYIYINEIKIIHKQELWLQSKFKNS